MSAMHLLGSLSMNAKDQIFEDTWIAAVEIDVAIDVVVLTVRV